MGKKVCVDAPLPLADVNELANFSSHALDNRLPLSRILLRRLNPLPMLGASVFFFNFGRPCQKSKYMRLSCFHEELKTSEFASLYSIAA
jgi:hypothetical protein